MIQGVPISTFNHITLLSVHLVIYAGFSGILSPNPDWASITLGILLIWVSVTDFRTYEIPDLASALLVLSGLALHWDTNMFLHVLGAVIWMGIFWSMSLAARHLFGQDGLGFGDVKLMAGLGAWLGPILPIYVVLCASVAAILTILITQRTSNAEISRKAVAFGPFLCLSAWVVWLSRVGI